MRPWRDVLSVNAWNDVSRKTDSTAHIGLLTSLKARFDGDIETPKRMLRQIGVELEAYHAIEKSELGTIDLRVRCLETLSSVAQAYLSHFKVDMQRASQRALMPPRDPKDPRDKSNMLSLHPNVNRWEKDPETHQYNSGNPQRESLDRNMLTLVRRSLRKADYLRRLKQYYAYESSTNPLDMIAYLRSPKEDGNGLVGLSPGVRMEALDPFHRPVELHIKNGVFHDGADLLDDMVGITAAFSAWLRGATAHSAPFFMWLEDHPICLRDDKAEVAGTRAVYYGAADSFEASPMGRVQLVNVGGVCMSVDLPTYRGQHICDTSDYQAAERKGGTGTAAYIWTADRELFIGQHREGAFHHSSFISGRQVRCAGMIKFAAGKVVYLSNNSGHYKPPKYNLRTFGSWLTDRGAMERNAKVLCLGGKDYEGDWSGFCRNYLHI